MHRVDTDTERVAVTLDRTKVPASPSLFLRSLLWEMFASTASRQEQQQQQQQGLQQDKYKPLPAWERVEFGATTNAMVVGLKEYGVVVKAVASSGKKGGGCSEGQLMVCPLEQAMEGVKEGDEVKVRSFAGC